MMFLFFVNACRKYGFTYSLNATNGLSLVLHPRDSLKFIEVKQWQYNKNYFKLFAKAIKEMKLYREESERN